MSCIKKANVYNKLLRMQKPNQTILKLFSPNWGYNWNESPRNFPRSFYIKPYYWLIPEQRYFPRDPHNPNPYSSIPSGYTGAHTS